MAGGTGWSGQTDEHETRQTYLTDLTYQAPPDTGGKNATSSPSLTAVVMRA